jgi:hypothetical protein
VREKGETRRPFYRRWEGERELETVGRFKAPLMAFINEGNSGIEVPFTQGQTDAVARQLASGAAGALGRGTGASLRLLARSGSRHDRAAGAVLRSLLLAHSALGWSLADGGARQSCLGVAGVQVQGRAQGRSGNGEAAARRSRQGLLTTPCFPGAGVRESKGRIERKERE